MRALPGTVVLSLQVFGEAELPLLCLFISGLPQVGRNAFKECSMPLVGLVGLASLLLAGIPLGAFLGIDHAGGR